MQLFFYIKHSSDSAIAQLVERTTVNRVVAGSSPACGVLSRLFTSVDKSNTFRCAINRVT